MNISSEYGRDGSTFSHLQEGGTYSLDHSVVALPLEPLKEKIAEQLSKMIVLIHPFYQFHFSNIPAQDSLIASLATTRLQPEDVAQIPGRHSRTQTAYIEKLLRLLRLSKNNVMLLGEEAGRGKETVAILRRQGFHGDILFYSTFTADPRPVIRGGYTSIYKHIVSLGAKELIVGGQLGFYPAGNQVASGFNTVRRGNMIVYPTGSSEASGINGYCVEGFIREILRVAQEDDSGNGLQQVVLSPVVCNSS